MVCQTGVLLFGLSGRYSLNIIFTKELLQTFEQNEVNVEYVWHFSLPPSEHFCPFLKF